MPRPLAESRPRAIALGIVLLLHLVLLAGALQSAAWRLRLPTAVEPLPLQVRILWARAPTAAPPPVQRTQATREPRIAARGAAAAIPARPAAAAAQAITLPAPAEPDPVSLASPFPAPLALPKTPALASSAPLDLRLPRGATAPWRARSPALDDPRSNSARAGFESRLANAMAGGDWVEERLDPDHVRFRRGDTCVTVERSRNDTLDPFNRSLFGRPGIVGKPEKC